MDSIRNLSVETAFKKPDTLPVETLLRDAYGNTASVLHFGSYAKAYEALLSLKNCIHCENCVNCQNCNDCKYCTDCVGCSECSLCVECKKCKDCIGVRGQYDAESAISDDPIPAIPNIHQLVYKAVTANPNLFFMGHFHGMPVKDNKSLDYDMHNDELCGTSHCRAGWVNFLAGPIVSLYEQHDSFEISDIAAMIYKKSGYEIDQNRFNHISRDDALADMKRLAELEAAGQAPSRDPMLDEDKDDEEDED